MRHDHNRRNAFDKHEVTLADKRLALEFLAESFEQLFLCRAQEVFQLSHCRPLGASSGAETVGQVARVEVFTAVFALVLKVVESVISEAYFRTVATVSVNCLRDEFLRNAGNASKNRSGNRHK